MTADAPKSFADRLRALAEARPVNEAPDDFACPVCRDTGFEIIEVEGAQPTARKCRCAFPPPERPEEHDEPGDPTLPF